MKINSIRTAIEFQVDIETIIEKKSVSYLEAIQIFTELHDLEVEVVASLVKQCPAMKIILSDECLVLNLVKKIE